MGLGYKPIENTNSESNKTITKRSEDITGRSFGKLTAISQSRINKGHAVWLCRCSCGGRIDVLASSLKRGATRSCGCLRYGKGHYNYKGGKHLNYKGYVMIMSKGHPRADRDGYVREHIIIMEKKIGRYLTENEIVHHKDRVRNNNTSDNLELKSKKEHDLIRKGIPYGPRILRD